MSKLYLRLLEWVIAFAVLGGAYFWVGHKAVSDYKAEQEVIQLRADKEQAERYNKVAGELEELKAKRSEHARTIIREVEKIVDRPVYRTDCIDNSGLLLINQAIKGRDSSEPDAALPAAD